MIGVLQRPVEFMQEISAKRIIKKFAQRFKFVYFGKVDPRVSEHQLIRGMTVAAGHVDDHYCVGSFRGHDITFVERRSSLRYPDKGVQDYRWMILQIDLKRHGLPHVFIDGHHYEEIFYANLFVKFANFDNAARVLGGHDKLFLRYFKVFASPDMLDEVADMMTPKITEMLAHHFRQFDYEIYDDQLLVYASNPALSPRLLPEMMRVGLWLADEINGQHQDGPVVDK